MEIVRFATVNANTVKRINRLLAQLSNNPVRITSAKLFKLINKPNFTIFVAMEDDEIAGMASIYFQDLLGRRVAWIEDVVVDESFRRRDIARALTERLIGEAKTWNVDQLNLTSSPEREGANILYRKLGFEQRDTNVFRMNLS